MRHDVAFGAVALTMILLSPASAHLFRDRPFAPEMAVIPAGSAMLGSSEEETAREGRTPAFAAFEHPQHLITIRRPFSIGVHHVTRGEFEQFARATKRSMAGCVVLITGKWSDGPDPAYSWANPGWAQRNDEPVTCVSWEDASAYAAWLSEKTRQHYRLPSEVEWEYAARAGTSTARWWGDGANDMCMRANGGDRAYAAAYPADKSANLTCDDGFAFTSPVDHYPASRWGLHDMYGNAWQWVADCFSSAGEAAPAAAPCKAHSIRGGSWHSSVSTLRSATRFSLPTQMRSSSLGFRVMREIEQ